MTKSGEYAELKDFFSLIRRFLRDDRSDTPYFLRKSPHYCTYFLRKTPYYCTYFLQNLEKIALLSNIYSIRAFWNCNLELCSTDHG